MTGKSRHKDISWLVWGHIATYSVGIWEPCPRVLTPKFSIAMVTKDPRYWGPSVWAHHSAWRVCERYCLGSLHKILWGSPGTLVASFLILIMIWWVMLWRLSMGLCIQRHTLAGHIYCCLPSFFDSPVYTYICAAWKCKALHASETASTKEAEWEPVDKCRPSLPGGQVWEDPISKHLSQLCS